MNQVKTKIKTGDTVEILKGKDRGKKSTVEKILVHSAKVIVKNINMVKKHVKPKGKQQGGIISLEKPIALANVQLVCPGCHKRTRIKIEGSGKNKQRICKKCSMPIEVKSQKLKAKS